MKVVYCIGSMTAHAGMETILFEKAKGLAEDYGYAITILTTDASKGERCFPDVNGIAYVDLGVDYYEELSKSGIARIKGIFEKRKLHKNKLQLYIQENHPDVIVSLGDLDEWILPSVCESIPIVNECHFHYSYRIDNYPNKLYQHLRLGLNKRIKSKYNRFVVLTEHDKVAWSLNNCVVIPNFSLLEGHEVEKVYNNHKVIAAGRLTDQKGFDILIQIWKALVDSYDRDKIWNLEIYGVGENKEKLQLLIKEYKLEDFVTLKGLSTDMLNTYSEASIFALPSRFEGFPLVLIEAMSCGLVPVAFDCKQGPNEIIEEGTGYLIPQYDIGMFADRLFQLMIDDDIRTSMSTAAKQRATFFSKESIMRNWNDLFVEVTNSWQAIRNMER